MKISAKDPPPTEAYHPDDRERAAKTNELRELLLGDQIILGGPKPGSKSTVFASFADILCQMKWMVSCERNSWKTSRERRKRFVDALVCLDDVTPGLRAEIDEARSFAATDSHFQMMAATTLSISALDELTNAVNRASQQPLLTTPELRIPAVDSWPPHAEVLEEKFHTLLPKPQAKVAAYRFIVNVLPWVTGEKPTFAAVAQHLKRSRNVNRDNDDT